MKPRHAIALALVGWYLVTPPVGPDGKPDPSARLSDWRVASWAERRTQKDCQDSLDYSRKHLDPTGALWPSLFTMVDSQGLHLADRRKIIAAYGRCIADDDPHFKGNVTSVTRESRKPSS